MKIKSSVETETYNILMAQNILNTFNLSLSKEQIFEALTTTKSIYYWLINMPMQNNLNAIILSQITSYKIFCQKRLIDFFIFTSPNDTDFNEDPNEYQIPSSVSDLLDQLQNLQQTTREIENTHFEQIYNTQSFLISYVRHQVIQSGRFYGYYTPEFHRETESTLQVVLSLKNQLIEYREQWHQLAINITNTLNDIGGYSLDEVEDFAQRSDLDFFQALGK